MDTAWDYYNLIREIECSNRQLKTDLNLRPIYHQKDKRSDAHLFLGLLAYWIVNIIRHQLKKENEKRKKADPDPKAEYQKNQSLAVKVGLRGGSVMMTDTPPLSAYMGTLLFHQIVS